MSLAYSTDSLGRYQVAYEAMDKVSIFKVNKYTWMWWCPCCAVGSYVASQQTGIHMFDRHMNSNHQDEE